MSIWNSHSFSTGYDKPVGYSLVLDAGNSEVAKSNRYWKALPANETVLKGGMLKACLGVRPGKRAGNVYLFRAKEGLDRLADPDDEEVVRRIRKLAVEVYPVVERAMVGHDRDGEPILPALGYHVLETRDGTFSTYPDPEALLANWQAIREDPQHPLHKPNLPDIQISSMDEFPGVKDLVRNYLEFDALLVSGPYYLHSQELILGQVLYFAWTDPEGYREWRLRNVEILRRIADRLDTLEARGADSLLIQKMWLLTGNYRFAVASQFGAQNPYAGTVLKTLRTLLESPYINEFFKRQLGEYIDMDDFEPHLKALVGACLPPEESAIETGDEQTGSSLLEAARFESSDFLRFLLEKRNPWKRQDSLGLSLFEQKVPPLVLTAGVQNLESMNLLLEYGELVNRPAPDWRQATALVLAVEKGWEAGVRRLLEAGADPAREWGEGNFAILTAAEFNTPDCLRLLLDYGAEVDQIWPREDITALYMATQKGHTECVRILLEHGADPNRACRWGHYTPLVAAAANGTHECMKLLLEKGAEPKKVCSEEDPSAWDVAVEVGDLKTVELMEAYLREEDLMEMEAESRSEPSNRRSSEESRDSMAGIEERVD